MALGCSSMTTGHHGARGHGGGDQDGHHLARLPHRRQGDQAGQERDHQRQRAEAADPAVGHDRQRPVAVGAGTQAVGGVGEPVLVQGAGHQRSWSRSRSAPRAGAAGPAARRRRRPARPAARPRHPPAGRHRPRPRDRAWSPVPSIWTGNRVRNSRATLRSLSKPHPSALRSGSSDYRDRTPPCQPRATMTDRRSRRGARAPARPAGARRGRSRGLPRPRRRAHQARRGPGPAGGAGGLAVRLAGAAPAAAGARADPGLRRLARHRAPGRLGLSRRGHRPDGGELRRRRRRDQPAGAAGGRRAARDPGGPGPPGARLHHAARR